MTEPTNHRLAGIFASMAGLLAAKGDNPYRVKAYRRAGETLRGLSEDVSLIAQRGELQSIDGIGKDLALKIQEFIQTGHIRAYDELRTPLPDEVKEWVTLPGFSEPVVHDLVFRLGIQTWEDLEMLVRSHLLRTLPGFHGSSEEVLEAIRKKGVGYSAPGT